MTETLSEGDIVEVRFFDIYEDPDWTKLDTIRTARPPRGKAVGYFFKEDEEGVILLLMIIINGATEATHISIPRGTITSVRRVEESEIDDFE